MTDQQSNEQRLYELARKWQEGTITPQERLEFDQWFDSFDDTEMAEPAGETPDQLKERLYASIRTKEKIRQRTGGRVLSTRWTVAAAILLLLGSATWWQALRSVPPPLVAATAPHRPDTVIVPGSNKAILTLGNGSQLILDSAKDGLLAQQGSTMIMKEKNGVVRYGESVADDMAPLYNTITTPRGGQYTVALPDGSKVWLNAASSIRFPTAFTGTSRDVEVRGEAYFEIAPDKTRPFRVAVNKKMDVEVLGTEFNVMAYEEEGTIKTTLINGAVRVAKDKDAPGGANDNDEKVLHPGQQAQLRPDGILHTLNNADIEAAIAWKNGRTVFAGEDIQTIMRQVSRWYDVDIKYAGVIPGRKFTGGIARNSDISVVLKILELNHIHFSVEGKTIVLMP